MEKEVTAKTPLEPYSIERREPGLHVSKWKIGDTVGVGCFIDSCHECEACKEGEEQFCEAGMSATYNGYEQDGKTPTYGGYSTCSR
jgi:uncharacterized zinc-type alcohol dehydrogenase-like protein